MMNRTFPLRPVGPLTLILLHGLGVDGRMWKFFSDRYRTAYHVLTPDLPGFGSTPPTEAPEGELLAEMAAWVSREIFPLAPGPILLGGYSMGGTVALKTALDYPGRVAGLALFCTSAAWGEGRRTGAPLLRLPGVARLLALGGRMAARTGARRLYRQGRVAKEDFSLLQTMLDGGNAGTEARCLRALVAADLRARLSEVRSPTLVAGGGHDRVSPPNHLERLARGISGANLHLEPGADHLYALSHPDDLAGRLMAFADLVAKGLDDDATR